MNLTIDNSNKTITIKGSVTLAELTEELSKRFSPKELEEYVIIPDSNIWYNPWPTVPQPIYVTPQIIPYTGPIYTVNNTTATLSNIDTLTSKQ